MRACLSLPASLSLPLLFCPYLCDCSDPFDNGLVSELALLLEDLDAALEACLDHLGLEDSVVSKVRAGERAPREGRESW